jgi:hypothetical protein
MLVVISVFVRLYFKNVVLHISFLIDVKRAIMNVLRCNIIFLQTPSSLLS